MQEMKECLIIDDDEDDQEIFLMCIRSISRYVNGRTANNGVDALAMFAAEPAYTPHYIFIDVNMPKMNGIECLKKLKAIARLSDTKMFMYSTTAEDTTYGACKQLGATEFIIKPTRTGELKEKLSAIFEIVSKINS